MSWVQARGSEMMSQHGFLGVPTETFETAGRLQLMALLNQGLCPESKVLASAAVACARPIGSFASSMPIAIAASSRPEIGSNWDSAISSRLKS